MSESPDAFEPPLSAPHEAAEVARIRTWNRCYKVAVIWVMGWVGLIVEKMVDLDDVELGLRDGAMSGAFLAPLLLILTLPLAWLGSQIGSWRRWQRYRLWFTFALPLLFVLMGVVGSLKGRYFPQERFRRMTGAEFPSDARVERVVFDSSIGALGEWACTYEFTCSAEEMERLIREMKLEKADPPGAGSAGSGFGSMGWPMTEAWRRNESRSEVGIWLETDATHTKVCVFCYVT